MATTAAPQVHLYYRLFLTTIEPISALVGAYFAAFRQHEYLSLTHAPSAAPLIPLGTSIVLNQLGNLYLYFALVEALVLRASADLGVWRALCVAMLIGDFGHLWSVAGLGWEVYYDVANYNAIDWGNVAFVYVGAATRIAFLMGFGVREGRKSSRARKAR